MFRKIKAALTRWLCSDVKIFPAKKPPQLTVARFRSCGVDDVTVCATPEEAKQVLIAQLKRAPINKTFIASAEAL